MASRVFVCYVPGLDARRITAQRTPFVEQLRTTCPTVALETFPGSDLLPSIVTGVYPHDHRFWQVSLRPEARSARRRLGDLFPASIATAFQAIHHLFDRSYDFPALPPRRRRQFDSHRLEYAVRERDARVLQRIGEFPTLFGMLASDSRYLFTRRLGSLERLGRELPSGQVALEFLDLAALDLLQRWHMSSPEVLERGYRATDEFIHQLHGRCRERGVTLMVLVDHGQEPVFGDIPLMRELRSSRVPEADYSFFLDLTLARFWFHSEGSRGRLTELLKAVPHTRLLSLKELRPLHIAFEDDAYGELFLSADPGWIFFPNDRHHPITNAWRALTDGVQRPRLFNPRQRGTHGYLPEHPSESGFAILDDTGRHALRPTAELIDVAPTLLTILGQTPPSYMRGRAIFG